MKKTLSIIALVVAPSAALANGHMPTSIDEKSSWNVYAGFGAGFDYLKGDRDTKDLTNNADLTRSKNLGSFAGRAEGYLGASWNILDSDVWLGLEPFISLSNIYNDNSSTTLNDYSERTINSKFSAGIDFRPSYQFNNGPHSVYALLGAEVRHLNVMYQDQDGTTGDKTKYIFGFTWGLGYEYRKNDSAFGFRFRNEIFSRQTVDFNFSGTQIETKVKPWLYSLMLTYKYYFKG